MPVARALLWIAVMLICGLTFVWPAAVPAGQGEDAYRIAAVAAMWTFLAALAALLWHKACKAPRT